MSRNGTLPTRLSNCPVPQCAACSYGKVTKVAKQTKVKKSINPPRKVSKPGDCVSVDVMTSKTPGLIA